VADLFDLTETKSDATARAAPLAERMRPRTLDEFAGQQHILGPGKLLRRAIEADRIASIILFGPAQSRRVRGKPAREHGTEDDSFRG
jgi:putative ATPase